MRVPRGAVARCSRLSGKLVSLVCAHSRPIYCVSGTPSVKRAPNPSAVRCVVQEDLLDALSMAASDATGEDVDLDPTTLRLQSLDKRGRTTDIEDDEDFVNLLKQSAGLRVTSVVEKARSRPESPESPPDSPTSPTRAAPLLLE